MAEAASEKLAVLDDFRLKRASDDGLPSADGESTSGGMGGGDGTRLDRLEVRMDAVEARLGRVEDKLDRLGDGVVRIEETLKHLASRSDVEALKASLPQYASATDMAFVKGRVERLPTMGKLAALLATAAGLWAFMPKIQEAVAKIPFPF